MKMAESDRYGTAEKCRAVLAVWTERKQASALCRELGVTQSLFSQWQDRAVSGMLEALEPRGAKEGPECPALPTQVKRLLDRKARSRELQSVGRSNVWRNRQVRNRQVPEASSSAAVS